jgi:hypothetical protein
MWDVNEKPLDPELRAKAQAQMEAAEARWMAMSREEREAYSRECTIRSYAVRVELEEADEVDGNSSGDALPPSRRSEAPSAPSSAASDLRAAVLDVLRENPDMLRAAVRDVLHEIAEKRKRDD